MMPTLDYARRAHNSLCTLLEHIHDKTIEVVSTEDRAWCYVNGEEVDCSSMYKHLFRKSEECHVDSCGNWRKDIYR